MRLGLLARKQGMTHIFDETGTRVPVTVLSVGPCIVTQIKTPEKDGYAAIQISFGDKKPQRSNKPEIGHFKKSKTTPKYHSQEFRVDAKDLEKFELGMQLTADNFQAGDIIDVVGTSKGRGFMGVMKRYNFSGFKASHGVHENYRGPGSMGSNTYPARIVPGKKLPGHMGDERMTIQNLKIVEVVPEENAILVKGSLPGHRQAMVMVCNALKRPAPKRDLAFVGQKSAAASEDVQEVTAEA